MGTTYQQPVTKVPSTLNYGTFGNKNNNTTTNKDNEDLIDNDSGMSSEETDESLKYDAKRTKETKTTLFDEVITKCLIEPQCDVHWNEIPSCSNNNIVSNVSVIVNDKTEFHLEAHDASDNKDSGFIVIDLTCDVNDRDPADRETAIGTKPNLDCDDTSIHSVVGTSQSIVPVSNEIMRFDNHKLVSLSLSILLAALLQAMQCFAQFLEDIVVPQR